MPNADTPVIILVRPQMGENIGAVARAMSNFGLNCLRIVAPRDGWPNPKAIEMAAGAAHIIENAGIYPDVPAAMGDIQIAYATSARLRDMEKPVMELVQAMRDMREKISTGVKVALLFGPERTGLVNEDISLCDTLITIPTAENQSLNIAQSAVLLGYEWHKSTPYQPLNKASPDIAPKEDWEGLFAQLEEYLDEADYFRVDHKKPIMWQNLKNMLMRGQWSPQEIRTFRGMLRSLWERHIPRHL